MARNLDIATLRSFVSVADTGGVTRAAQRLHLTQSGVSMQLKRLEEALGAQLLSREGRGVALTKAGEELLASARKMVALNDEIWERMTATPYEGELTLGMPHDIVTPIAPAVLRRFAADFPAVRVNLISPPSVELLSMLSAGKVDVILTTEDDVGRGGEALVSAPLIWIGAKGGRAWRKRPISLAFGPNCTFRKTTFDALDAAGIDWAWTVATEADDAVYASVAADLAVVTMIQDTHPEHLEPIDHAGALPSLPPMNINLYTGAGRMSALGERLAEYVRAAVLDLPAAAADRPRRVA